MKIIKTIILLVIIIIILISSCVTNVIIPQGFIDDAKVNSYPIIITKVDTGYPNSAGGVYLELAFTNISDKTIKYAVFSAEAFNAVNDPVRCSIRNDKYSIIKVTGPIKPLEFRGVGTVWSNVWYNPTIKYAKIKSVNITFMDNITLDFNESDVKNMTYSK